MTPEQLQELEEKAKLWDEISGTFHKLLNPIKQHKDVVFDSKPISEYKSTIENTSNTSSHIGLLEEESKEMVEIRDFDTDIEKYENELYCSMCGNDDKKTFIYDRSVANGEIWNCKDCGKENIVNHEPKADDY